MWLVGWKQLRASYDRVAGKYEGRFIDELSGKPRDRELLDAFATAVGDPVVEVGCGPGQIGAYVRAHRRRVFGADISFAMATRAWRRLDAAVVADMQSLPLATGTAAGLLAFYSLIHLPRRGVAGVLREFARVLRPGGRVLFSAHEGQGEAEVNEFIGEEVSVSVTFFELDELLAATRAAGLEIVFAERRAPYAIESEKPRLYVEARRPAPATLTLDQGPTQNDAPERASPTAERAPNRRYALPHRVKPGIVVRLTSTSTELVRGRRAVAWSREGTWTPPLSGLAPQARRVDRHIRCPSDILKRKCADGSARGLIARLSAR